MKSDGLSNHVPVTAVKVKAITKTCFVLSEVRVSAKNVEAGLNLDTTLYNLLEQTTEMVGIGLK